MLIRCPHVDLRLGQLSPVLLSQEALCLGDHWVTIYEVNALISSDSLSLFPSN